MKAQARRALPLFLLSFFLATLTLAGPARAGANYSRQNYTPGGCVATNATFTGPWIPIRNNGAVGFQVKLTGTSSPTGTWGADVTDDDDPNNAVALGAAPLTLSSAQTAQNPAGDAANIAFLFQFDPAPPARWMRFKLTISGGGSASKLLCIGVAGTKGSQ